MLTSFNMEFGFDEYRDAFVSDLNKTTRANKRKKKQIDNQYKKLDKLQERYDKGDLTDKQSEKLKKKIEKLEQKIADETTYNSTNPNPDRDYVVIKKSTKMKIVMNTLMTNTPETDRKLGKYQYCVNSSAFTGGDSGIPYNVLGYDENKGEVEMKLPSIEKIIKTTDKMPKLKAKNYSLTCLEYITAKTNLSTSKTDVEDGIQDLIIDLRNSIDDDVQKIKKKKQTTFYLEVFSKLQVMARNGKINNWAYLITQDADDYDDEDDELEVDEEAAELMTEEELEEEEIDWDDSANEEILQQYINSRERGDFNDTNSIYS